ncbi:MAG: Ribulose-phosphate 3-epimerase [Parcubacteria group bacterium GW2011_GWA2_42_11]|nr:MAG: Ribulose-phosphate 3-epimerase [Parcubacteria group bacterium GW2011_GWA2_42_11]
MTEVIASVLPFKTYEELKNKIESLRSVVSTIQIDLCDGIFVPSQTWPFTSGGFDDYDFQKIMSEEQGLPFWDEFDFEIDLMVADAVENFDIYMKLGAKRMIFHMEAMESLDNFRDFLEGIDLYIRDNIQIGIAFKPSMPLQNVFSLIPFVDFVQCMGNDKIGFGGVPLDEKVYNRIELLREKHPDLPIEVDIGVNGETAPKLVEAGATKLITGSALFNSYDKIGFIERFQNL